VTDLCITDNGITRTFVVANYLTDQIISIMLKQFLSIAAVCALAFTTFSCQSGGNDAVRDAARQTVETVTPPAAPTAPQPNVAVPAGPVTTVAFAENGTFDFGTVTEGEIVSHTFSFTNTGSEPLIISDAKGSFNSKNKKGARNQKVTITANTNPAQSFIYLTGTVNPDPNAGTQK